MTRRLLSCLAMIGILIAFAFETAAYSMDDDSGDPDAATKVYDAIWEAFTSTSGRWKVGKTLKIRNKVYGNTIYIRNYYAKGSVMQVFDDGTKSLILHFRSAKVDGIIDGLKNDMTKQQVIDLMGERPAKDQNNRITYISVTDMGDDSDHVIFRFENGKLAGMECLTWAYFDFPEYGGNRKQIDALIGYDTNAPKVF